MNDPELITTIVIYAIALVLFIVLSFLFSSADMAYGSVDVLRLEKEASLPNAKKSVIRAHKLASEYDKTISTILFLNDTVNAGLDTIATLLGVNLCYLLVAGATSSLADNWGLVTSLIALSLKITFGEIVPKSVSKVNNFKLSILYSGWVNVLRFVFAPITYPAYLIGSSLSKASKKGVPEVPTAEDDLHEMVDEIEEQGTVDENLADMLHETIRYTHTEAFEIMTPRVSVFAIDIEDSLEDILKEEELFDYGRIPVYQDTIDNIIGYIQTKTLIIKLASKEEFSLEDILIEPLRFPTSVEINDILRQFKKTKKQLALIMDEYGGVAGIVTLEDILEEIVGEIYDEDDSSNQPIVERKDGSYIIDGNVTLEDFCNTLGLNYEEINTEYVTIGGFVVELLNDQFAKQGDEVDFQNIHIKVLALDENGAVERLLVTKKEEE